MKAFHLLGAAPLYTNSFVLISDAGHAVVIDPAAEVQEYDKIFKENNATLATILCTHGHYDHTTAVPELEKALPQAAIYIHRGDANGAGNTLFPLAGQVAGLNFYDEGDHIQVGSIDVQVLHTPGHSKGSVTLKAGDVLFTGDTLFAGSCGRTDLRGGSYEEIMASLKRLGQLEGDYHVCPGHDITSTLEQERKTNYYLREAMEG